MTRHQEVYSEDCALYVLCSQVQLARVVVRVLVLVDVLCVMLILIARVEIHVVIHAVDIYSFRSHFSVVEMYSLHSRCKHIFHLCPQYRDFAGHLILCCHGINLLRYHVTLTRRRLEL